MTPRPLHDTHWADLDGLRALAILLVLGRHSLRPFTSEEAYRPVATVGAVDFTPALLNGWVGVDLFFVLSGFLIGRQVWRGTEGVGRFWFRRAARILPAYWTCLALVAMGLTAAGAWSGKGIDFLAHVVMLQDYTGSVFVAAFWSLGTEEKFYLLAPLLAVAITRATMGRGQAAALLVLWTLPVASRAVMSSGVSAPIGYERYFATFRSPFHLAAESLVVGFAIAWMLVRRPLGPLGRSIREGLFWGGAAALAGWLATDLILGHIDRVVIVAVPALIGLACGAMVLAVVNGAGSYSRVLSWSGWRPVAEHSYTLYLTHMMVLPIALALAVTFPALPGDGDTRQWLSFLPWYLSLACASSYVLTRFVERPALAWRDRRLADWPRAQASAVSRRLAG